MKNSSDLLKKFNRDAVDLWRALQIQQRFLENSANLFDEGCFVEGLRLATSIRILLHDTCTSKSLLGQLGLIDKIHFLSSYDPNDGYDTNIDMLSKRLKLVYDAREINTKDIFVLAN